MRRYGDDLVARYERAAAPGGTSIEKLRRLFYACLDANLEQPEEESILIREFDGLFREPEFASIHETLERIEKIFVGVIEAGVDRSEIRPDVDARFLHRMMMDVMGAVPRWYDPLRDDKEAVVNGWIDVFTRGVARRAES